MTARQNLNVLITGGSGPSGIAVARALREAGFNVFTVGSDSARIAAAAAAAGGGVTALTCDLASLPEVRELRGTLLETAGRIDGVIHLVGGWRGAKGITDQSDEDWAFLERNAITTLRNVTRVFYDELAASKTGRFAMVSSTAVSAPAAGIASYAAAKAAAEAWTMAVAQGFRSGQAENPDGSSAAVVLVVKALVDAGMRQAAPERKFPGYTDVDELGAAVVRLFSTPAAELNGQRILLTP
ncbi:SDR family oxidoreductase [Arthrobacter sp. 92]|uniref:SDR family oxidoreductase n=1 Tax=Arthrobacter sp. 92 TaxID=3418175 RepID=UPI003CFDEE9D